MFIHNFIYSLKTLFRNKALLFWTFAFPIILGTFFKMAFSDIESSEKLDIINIAIINNDDFNNNEVFKTAFKTLGDKDNRDRLFDIKYTSESEAKKLLDDGEISGYLMLKGGEPKVTISTNGVNETVLKYVTEEIVQTSDIAMNTIGDEMTSRFENGEFDTPYEEIYTNVLAMVSESEANIKDISSNNLSYTMIEFYTLIAMACLYGGILGMVAINQNLPNMTSQGKRISVSPSSKGGLVLSSVLAGYVTQIVGVALLFLYTIFALKVDYGNNLGLVILLAMVGSLAGLSLGIAVATIIKAGDNAKTGIMISITMVWSFLSGMMGITMKYIIDKNIPIINLLNPVNMITDGYYALYYYDTLDRYMFNVYSLLIFTVVLIVISYFSLRRQKYDSI